MNTKFYFRIWVVICGLSFAYGYVRRITFGDDFESNFLLRMGLSPNYNWFDKIVFSIYEVISWSNGGLAVRVCWGLSTMIIIGLSSLLLGLALQWVKNSISSKSHS